MDLILVALVTLRIFLADAWSVSRTGIGNGDDFLKYAMYVCYGVIAPSSHPSVVVLLVLGLMVIASESPPSCSSVRCGKT